MQVGATSANASGAKALTAASNCAGSEAFSAPLAGAGDTLGSGIGQAMPSDLLAADEGVSSGKKGIFKNEMVLGLALFILAILIYIGMKIYQKR